MGQYHQKEGNANNKSKSKEHSKSFSRSGQNAEVTTSYYNRTEWTSLFLEKRQAVIPLRKNGNINKNRAMKQAKFVLQIPFSLFQRG